MERYVCIHGHFYQPPRENAWLETVELQDSAYPYHDWNERVTAECYSPNARSRILDSRNCITKIINNYSSISFNFGPTLLAWMTTNSPETYEAILEADRLSQDRFGGHGSALAQPYNHVIMPLANSRDKHTQALWGIRDFEHRFGRKPEGIWLPETAVDLETLEMLAALDIKFTILAQHQASRVRKIGANDWQDVNGARIDPSMAYRVSLPSGRIVSVFFYDGPISRAVAFEGLLANGDTFARRLLDGFDSRRTWAQLVNIATDGESYGHHHQFGDMALAYALQRFNNDPDLKLTNYGQYLEKHPPTHEVQIVENTSWSCSHGVERWRSDCGCSTGGGHGWNQAWRTPLREGMDFLRDGLAPRYEEAAARLFDDPWKARDDYIELVLDRSPSNTDNFMKSHESRKLDANERVSAMTLLELQRNAMLMYTSCGWFFNEISGIETLQVLQYAGRVVQLANELFGDSIEGEFLRYLESARSNIPEKANARKLYDEIIRPSIVDLSKVAAHYAMSSLFEEYEGSSKIYCFTVESEHYHREDCGKTRLAVGRVKVTSDITTESGDFSFGVVHLGDHNLNAGVRIARPRAESYNQLLHSMVRSCLEADFPSAIRLLDTHFPDSVYSLKTLFRDEQRKIIQAILSGTLDEVEQSYRQIYSSNFPLMRFLASLGNPLPKVLESTAEFIVNHDLTKMLDGDPSDVEAIKRLLADAASWNIKVDQAALKHTFEMAMARRTYELVETPGSIDLLNHLIEMVELGKLLPSEVDWGIPQNFFYTVLKRDLPQYQAKAAENNEAARIWIGRFTSLGDKLAVCTD